MRRPAVRAAMWCALIAGLALDPSSGGREAPDFSGSWVRDQRASDDPVEKAKDQNVQAGAPRRRPFGISFPGGVWYPGSGRGPSRGGGGGGGTTGPGGGTPGAGTPGSGGGPYGGGPTGGPAGRGGGGSGGGGRGGQGPELDIDGAVRLAGGVQAWSVDHREPQIVIRDANRETRVLFTDGRVMGDGIDTKTIANWRGDTLEVETKSSLGVKTERWQLDHDREVLTVVTTLELGRGNELSFTTVFDRVEGGATATAGAGSVQASAGGEGGLDEDARGPTRDDAEPVVVAAKDAEPVDAPARDPADAPPARGPADAPWPDPELAERELESHAETSRIRVLPPPRPGGALLSGKVMFDTLTIDPEVTVVEFYLDGHRSARRAWPPFQAKLDLDSPPREQVVRVVARGADDRVLGEDEMVVNRVDPPFKVRIASMKRIASGGLDVTADVSIPRLAQLERVVFFLGDQKLGEMTRPPFVARVEAADVDPEAFVRVVAALSDGRERENVALLDEKVFVEHVDVRMVELQLVVTDRTGTAVGGLAVEDFEIVEGKKTLRPEQLYPAERVGLLLGLAIDSSGSMWPLWDQTRAAATYFLDHTLQARDRAFLVDFDSQLRLIEPPTPDPQRLVWGLERLYPHGGTVLYDSILFSMLQYEGESGRRALIVITDGVDSESRSDPTRAIEYGRRLGVPVYVVALSGVERSPVNVGWQHSSQRGAVAAEEAMARNEIKLITDPTGGRLFSVASPEQMSRAFAEIQEELHRQYVLTYYTELQPGEGGPPEVKVRRPGLEVRSAVPLETAQ